MHVSGHLFLRYFSFFFPRRWGKNKKVKSVIKILSKNSKNQGTITSKTYLQALSDDLNGFLSQTQAHRGFRG